jgi:hypothetical protein
VYKFGIMWSRARIAAVRPGLLVASCLLASLPCRAADPGAAGPWDALVLKGGRVLHNAKVMSDEGDSLVIRCDEGLVKVPKSIMPQAANANPPPPAAAGSTPAQEMVMMPFNPDSAPTVPEPQEKPKPKPKPAPTPSPVQKAALNPVFKGCTITSFTMRPFQTSLGCAEVVIQNGTEAPVLILPGDIACITAEGKRLAGRQIVMDGFPPIIRRRQVVPPEGSIDIVVTFSNDALDTPTVQWAR